MKRNQNKADKRALTWSYGGGVQSVAIAVLITEAKLPRPEIIVMADTGREGTETWEYTEKYVLPLLSTIGCQIEVASHDLSKVDLYSKGGDVLIPAFTAKGKLQTFCSVEWKRRVIRRYLRQKGIIQCRTWLGISADEVERIKPSDRKWQEYWWPLVYDLAKPVTRNDCLDIVHKAGLPRPPKSSCWMCPHRGDSQWLRLKLHFPNDWKKAVELDYEIRSKDGEFGLFLHRARKPLDEVEFVETDDAADSEIKNDCNTGNCWT